MFYGAIVPETVEFGFGAGVIGGQVEDGLRTAVPEYLVCLHAPIDLFDRRCGWWASPINLHSRA